MGGEYGGYPRFSAGEMARRWRAVAAEAERERVDVLLVYGSERNGSAVQWLSQWPVTREAALCWSPGDAVPVLFVQFANHLDTARRIALDCDVRWGGDSTLASVVDALGLVRRRATRVGILGPLGASAATILRDAGAELVFMDRAYLQLRLVKSPEEIDWIRRGAGLTDAAVRAVAEGAGVGTSETELVALAEGAYLPSGGTTHIHYFCSTPMRSPAVRVPAQWPTDRRLRAGDVVACEVSAAWWGYPGQLLRTFTVEEPPTALYAELHAVAMATFDALAAIVAPGVTGADLAEAARLAEQSGFSTCDDLVHGFVGGYHAPVVPGGGRTPQHGSFVLEEGMTVVVQPNVVTPEGTAGVQTGELLLVTATGCARVHTFARGLGALAGPS